MAIQENLIYFLKNGRLENINFGITKEQLIEILGVPEYVSRHSFADFYRYGDFEFYILKENWKTIKSERFFCILIYVSEFYIEKENFTFQSYGWTNKLSIEEAISFLNEHQIKFEEKSEPDENDVRSIYTEGNVFIQFRDWEETGKLTLYKYGRKVELNPIKPLTKQVSFEIEEIYYEQLRNEAEKTRISIANLCREIVEKHLKSND